MRIAIVGTSNSLKKNGYASAIAHSSKVTAFKNMSIGKSVSLLFAVSTEDVDFSQYDFCLMDFTVNEEVFVRRGVSREAIRSYVVSLTARVWKAGCLPVMLMLPRQSAPVKNSQIRDVYLAIAQELNIPFFDVIEYIERLEQRHGIARKDLFQDDGHLAEWFAISVGHQLLDALSALRRITRERHEAPWSSYDFRPIAAAPLVKGTSAVVPRANSLFQIDFAGLAPLQNISIPVPAGSRIEGLYVNLAATAGFLCISGATTEIIDLRNAYQSQGREIFVLSTIALQRAVPSASGMIDIEVVPEHTIDPARREAVLIGIPEREKPADLGYVELGGIIVRSAEEEWIGTRPPKAMHVDIAQASSSAAPDAAIDIYRSHTITSRRTGV